MGIRLWRHQQQTFSLHDGSMTFATKKLVHVQKNNSVFWVGDGFPVVRPFSFSSMASLVSPFLLMDYVVPYHFKPSPHRRGVGAHPHRGIETVTLVFQGEIEHRDSFGGGGVIGPGEVQWMTAGAGVVHDERHSAGFSAHGGVLELIQLWVNLPSREKMTNPRYQSLKRENIPQVELPGNRGLLNVVAGEFGGARGPAVTHTPIDLWTVAAASEGPVQLHLRKNSSALIFIRKGKIRISEHQVIQEGNIVIFDREGQSIEFWIEQPTELVVLSGEAINEPIVAHGPFVMNTQAEIIQAYADFENGKMGQIKTVESE